MKDKIIVNDGSIQTIDNIPNIIKQKYKTVFKKQRLYICLEIEENTFVNHKV